jgi:hypothetical protein
MNSDTTFNERQEDPLLAPAASYGSVMPQHQIFGSMRLVTQPRHQQGAGGGGGGAGAFAIFQEDLGSHSEEEEMLLHGKEKLLLNAEGFSLQYSAK